MSGSSMGVRPDLMTFKKKVNDHVEHVGNSKANGVVLKPLYMGYSPSHGIFEGCFYCVACTPLWQCKTCNEFIDFVRSSIEAGFIPPYKLPK